MLLAWRGLRYRYAQGLELCFEDFELPLGAHLLLRGKSGSGKSTLLALMAGLLSPEQGQISMAGVALQDLSARQRDAWRGAHLGFVPQRLHLSPSLTVLENLALPFIGAGLPADEGRARTLLGRLGLEGDELARRRPHQLSLGQAQRVALARALIRRPQLLLADEPSANLDDESTQQMVDLLLETTQEMGTSLVLATHDARVAQYLAASPTGAAWREFQLSPRSGAALPS
ncbi:ABC transporter ATP-binding protein [Roseateles sp.]|uniref:ABC transporter ATP-binding protein n=1 Tax=Roseateles sp. TaxID=1971397 RepID=UPI003BA3F83E